MKKDFNPILRFMVVSDIHIKDKETVERERFAKAIRDAYSIAEKGETYKRLDAIAIVGDYATDGTELQFKAAKKILDDNIKADETLVIAPIASHEFGAEGVEAALEKLKRIMGKEPDTHDVINGFHFIAITPSKGTRYDESKKAWMEKELKEAAKADKAKPIFVFQHPHNTDTVYGSMIWGEDDLTAVYMNYPQIIHFSGHSHAPINDPRSIHQLHFTSLGTGTLSYFENDEFDKYYGTLPIDKEKAAQMLIVEADAENRVRVYPYDVLTGNYFLEPWEIDKPSDPSSFIYTREIRMKNATNPYFEEDAKISINAGEDYVEFEFPQAKIDSDPFVNSYDVRIKDSEGFTARAISFWSEYYFYDMPKTMKERIDGLDSEKEYTIEITANGFWNNSSKKPLTASFKTK